MAHPFFDVPRPVVIGHRGSAGTHPENTLASFRAALEAGATILESDIQLTRDGIPVLLHDPEVDRVTDGVGAAAAMDFAALARLDAGCQFAAAQGMSSDARSVERIPSLEQAFEAFPESRFNLEIKSPDPRAIGATLDLIDRFGRSETTLLAAENDEIMKAIRAACASHPARPATSASLPEVVESIACALEGRVLPAGVMALQIPATFADQPLATRELVEHAHAHDVAVHVWTINDLVEIEELLGRGVDGIVTDHPARMASWLRTGTVDGS